MDIYNSRAGGVKFLLLWVLVVLLIGIIGSSLTAQSYEQADSVSLVQVDSLYQLYFEWKKDNGEADFKLTEPMDSSTIANFAFNIGVGAGSVLVDASKLKMQEDRIKALQHDVGDVLQTLLGVNFRQRSEQVYINNLAYRCDSLGTTCEGFYTLTRRNEPNRIIRIRNNGQVRQVNSNGSNTAGGIQGSVLFVAGSNRFEIVVTAPANLVGTLTFTTIDAKRERLRWSTDDAKATRYTLIQRKRLSDTGSQILGK